MACKAGTLPLMHNHTHTFGFVMATVPSSEFVVMMLSRFSASSLPNRGRQRTTTFTASRLMVAVVVGVGEAAQANAYYAKGSSHGNTAAPTTTTAPTTQLKLHDVGCGVHYLCVWKDCACLMCGWGGQGRLSAQRAAGKLCSAGRGPIAACRLLLKQEHGGINHTKACCLWLWCTAAPWAEPVLDIQCVLVCARV